MSFPLSFCQNTISCLVYFGVVLVRWVSSLRFGLWHVLGFPRKAEFPETTLIDWVLISLPKSGFNKDINVDFEWWWWWNYVEDGFDDNEQFCKAWSQQIRWFMVTPVSLLLCRPTDNSNSNYFSSWDTHVPHSAPRKIASNPHGPFHWIALCPLCPQQSYPPEPSIGNWVCVTHAK